jgi:hypothetical protein
LLAKLRRDGISSVESNQSYENFQADSPFLSLSFS